MTLITQYKTIDGAIFDTEEAAHKHEILVAAIEKAVKPLGKRLEYHKSQEGWVWHKKENVEKAKLDLLKLIRPLAKNFPELLEDIDKNPLSIHPMSFIGRLLDDNDTPIKKGWGRLQCIDDLYREHNQPYFALNGPDKDMICVEDRR